MNFVDTMFHRLSCICLQCAMIVYRKFALRPLWGLLLDQLQHRRVMTALFLLASLLIGTLSLTERGGRWMFMTWICLIYWCSGGFYAIFPSHTSTTFGALYMVGNYGWVYSSQFISGLVAAFLIKLLISLLGNLGLTLFLCVFLLIGACVSFFGKPWDYHIGRQREEAEIIGCYGRHRSVLRLQNRPCALAEFLALYTSTSLHWSSMNSRYHMIREDFSAHSHSTLPENHRVTQPWNNRSGLVMRLRVSAVIANTSELW